MPIEPKEVVKWSPVTWDSNVKMLIPSGDGAMGVLFAFAHQTPEYRIPQADFVIKPIATSAANVKFAESVLEKGAKATSLASEEVSPKSALGQAILGMIDRFVTEYEKYKLDAAARSDRIDDTIIGGGTPRDLFRANNANAVGRKLAKARHDKLDKPGYPPAYGERLKDLQRACKGATTLLVQRMAQGMRGMDDEIKEEGLVGILRDRKLMKNLGRMYVADAVLGNGDRIDHSVNMGNIALGAEGTLFAIDSGTVLASFDALLYDAQKGGGLGIATSAYMDAHTGTLTSGSFAQGQFSGGQAVASKEQVDKINSGTAVTSPFTAKETGKELVVFPPAAQLELLFDPAKVWARFRLQMEKKLNEINAVRRANSLLVYPFPAGSEWNDAFSAFNDGVISGLKRIDNLLSGFAWLRTKSQFKSLVKAHGGDANMDWTTFKMRRMIVHLARKGVPLAEAQKQAAAYAEKKLAHVAAF